MFSGDRLRAAREQAKMTQSELAAKGKTSIDSIARYESGKAPNADKLLLFARALNTTVAYLMGETDDPRPGFTPIEWLIENSDDLPDDVTPEELERFSDVIPDTWKEQAKRRSRSRVGNKTKTGVGDEPVWVPIVEPVACAGSGNGYPADATWEPVGEYPMFRADLITSWDTGLLRIIRLEGDSMEPRYHDGDMLLFAEQRAESGETVLAFFDGRLYVRGLVLERGTIHLKPLNPQYAEIVVTPEDERLQVIGKILGKVPRFERDRGFF